MQPVSAQELKWKILCELIEHSDFQSCFSFINFISSTAWDLHGTFPLLIFSTDRRLMFYSFMKTVFCFHFVVQEIKSAILCFVRRNRFFFAAAHYKKQPRENSTQFIIVCAPSIAVQFLLLKKFPLWRVYLLGFIQYLHVFLLWTIYRTQILD
jgi:hypothetical protein